MNRSRVLVIGTIKGARERLFCHALAAHTSIDAEFGCDHTATPWRVGHSGAVVAFVPVVGMPGSDATEYYGGHMICESVTKPNARRQVEEVTAYRCPKCGDLHEYRSDAETCCQVSAEESLSGTNCPVCGESHYDHRNAADCCLWKDLDGPTRWRIADAVEAGSEWVEELGMTALSMLPNGANGAH